MGLGCRVQDLGCIYLFIIVMDIMVSLRYRQMTELENKSKQNLMHDWKSLLTAEGVKDNANYKTEVIFGEKCN